MNLVQEMSEFVMSKKSDDSEPHSGEETPEAMMAN
jgi:hypothetical protein